MVAGAEAWLAGGDGDRELDREFDLECDLDSCSSSSAEGSSSSSLRDLLWPRSRRSGGADVGRRCGERDRARRGWRRASPAGGGGGGSGRWDSEAMDFIVALS